MISNIYHKWGRQKESCAVGFNVAFGNIKFRSSLDIGAEAPGRFLTTRLLLGREVSDGKANTGSIKFKVPINHQEEQFTWTVGTLEKRSEP